MADAVRGIRYPNFKGTVESHARHEAYMEVWSSMYRSEVPNESSEKSHALLGFAGNPGAWVLTTGPG
jgi:hypothetical protein